MDSCPPAPASSRPPALAVLEAGKDCRLILLVAPAGSGKTSLLQRWAAQNERAFAWIPLYRQDNRPQNFYAKVWQAIRAVCSLLPADLPRFHSQIQAFDLEAGMVGILNSLTDLSQDLYLVFDNYHEITSAETQAAVQMMLDYPPSKLHLVIASRSQPPLQLPRLRARRQLAELGPELIRLHKNEPGHPR